VDEIRNTRILSTIQEILIPKTPEQIVEALIGFYEFEYDKSEIDVILNLHKIICVNKSDHPSGVLSFIDYVKGKADENEMQTLGLQIFTKKIEITKKVESFTKIYKEVKEKINEHHITYEVPSMNFSKKQRYQYAILGAGNKIMQESRRGPANFVILNTEMFLITHPMISSMKIVIDDTLENEMIVGRNGAADEPGIMLIIHKNKYIVTTLGKEPDKFYVKIPYEL